MCKVLIADDDKLIRQGITKILETGSENKFEIYTATNGTQAYELLRDDLFSILISDIKMPGLTGVELLKKVKTDGLKVKTIVLSGYDDFHYVREMFLLGVEDYLLKPVRSDVLIEKIEKMYIDSTNRMDYIDVERYIHNKDDASSRDCHMIEEAIQFIYHNYYNNVSQEMVAEMLELNKSYFCQLFKRVTDQTFSSVLLSIRMEKAKELLHEGKYKVYEIGERVGYMESVSFNRAFKRYCGKSPKKYIEENKK